MGEWIDISQPLLEGMHPVSRRPDCGMRLHTVNELDEQQGLPNLQLITILGHQGTHIDTPAHMLTGGASIDRFPVERFVGTGVVLHIPKELGEAITLDDVQSATPAIQPNDFAVISTGMEQYIPTEDYFNSAFLSLEAARWLVAQGIRIIGHDMIGVDPLQNRTPNFQFPVHKEFLANDVLIVGQLCNLERLRGKRAEFFFFPLNVLGADGAPTRAVAHLTE